MNPKNLDPELRAKVDACATPEEIVALAKEEGYALTDDEIDQISGGGVWNEDYDGPTCPRCGADGAWGNGSTYKCPACGYEFLHSS